MRSLARIPAVLAALGSTALAQNIAYVDVDAPPGGDGTSWATAFDDLQDALAAAAPLASPIDQIWIAEGTYLPTAPGGAQTDRFDLVEGVFLYGGFDGTEALLSERDVAQHASIMSGDLNGDDVVAPGWLDPSMADNVHVVVTALGTTLATGLDGLTITAGANFPTGQILRGGGLYVFGGTLTLRDCTFIANTTANEGGALNIVGNQHTVTVESCTFEGNSASGGGAISTVDANLVVIDSTFTGNGLAGGDGGAITARSSSTPVSLLQLTGCTFDGNQVDDRGGAIYARLVDTLAIDGCTFTNNSSSQEGGAVWSWCLVENDISNSEFSGNHGSRGGATFADGTTHLLGCEFTQNTANTNGGAVFSEGPHSVEACSFEANSADRGGALYAERITDVRDSEFRLNSSTSAGGAIMMSQRIDVSRSLFTGNTSTSGGAINATSQNGSQSRISACEFIANTASFGGALRLRSGSDHYVVNCLFSNNSAVNGAGIQVVTSSGASGNLIESCTIVDNAASNVGGGIHQAANPVVGSLDVRHCILWGNTSSRATASSQLSGDLVATTVSYCALEGGPLAVAGEGNWSFDPEFVDPLGPDGTAGTLDDDYRLAATSPYRDAGSLALVSADDFDDDGDLDTVEPLPLDLDGAPRQIDDPFRLDTIPEGGPAIDLGAYETAVPAPPCSSSRYCVGGVNSTGAPASIRLNGSLSLSSEALTLTAHSCPPNKVGVFLYGATPNQIPFGDGFLCVSNAIFRLNPPVVSSADGVFERAIDFEAAPTGFGPGKLTVGTTWNFQLWYRDPQGPGGNGFNTSDAASLDFCP